jgi:hypothetical protein
LDRHRFILLLEALAQHQLVSWLFISRQREGMYGAEFDHSGEYIAVAVKNTVQVFDRNLVYKYKLKDLGHEAVRPDLWFFSFFLLSLAGDSHSA